jgi:23S rRNA U2552 (ribose-2'-O)-methylase RlmE/FtsJ
MLHIILVKYRSLIIQKRFTSSLRSTSSNEWLKRQLSDPYVRAREAAGYRSRAAFKLFEINERFRILTRGASVVDLGAAPGGWTQVAVDAVGSPTASSPRAIDLTGGPHARDTAINASQPSAVSARARVSFFDLGGDEALRQSPAVPPPPALKPSRRPSAPTSSRYQSPLVIAVDLEHVASLPGAQMVRGDFTDAKTRAAVASCLSQGRTDVVLSDMAHAFTGESGLDHTRQMALAWSSFVFAAGTLRAGGHWCAKVRYGPEYGLLRAAVSRIFEECIEVKPPASRIDSAEAFLLGRRLRAAQPALLPTECALLKSHGIKDAVYGL